MRFFRSPPPSALVLDVGSGHAPHPRAHVLVDMNVHDTEREGRLVHDRPLVVADAHSLPFRSDSFSEVIAHQVMEHAERPQDFLRELSRVGGLLDLEMPSPLMEVLFQHRPFHRWVFARTEEGLVAWSIEHVPKAHFQGSIVERLYRSNILVYLLIRGSPEVFLTSWRGGTPRVTVGAAAQLDRVVEEAVCLLEDRSLVVQVTSSLKGLVHAIADKVDRELANRRRRMARARSRRTARGLAPHCRLCDKAFAPPLRLMRLSGAKRPNARIAR